MAMTPLARAITPSSARSIAAPPRSIRRRRFIPPARKAGILLLVAWLGPVTFVQTDAPLLLRWFGAPERASAYTRVIPAGEAMLLRPGTTLKLRLREGGDVEGRFLGRALLDPVIYAGRFASRTDSSWWAPFALGETLRVTLVDGREWVLPFAGYGELALLLERPDSPDPLRVPFEFAREVRGSDGEEIEAKALSRAFRAGKLPSAEVLVLEQLLPLGSQSDRWAMALRIPVEDIRSASLELPSSGTSPGSSVGGGIALGLIAGIVVFYVILANAAKPSSSGCTSYGSGPTFLSSVALTPLPFDLDRGCYVGEALAVAEPWQSPVADGPAVALTLEER
jgi:hypothetical protein